MPLAVPVSSSLPRGRWPVVMIVASVLTSVGCGRTYVPVEGIVTVGGRPAAEGMTVLFSPVGNTRTAIGHVRGEGRYRADTAGILGIMPGDYRVAVIAYGNEVEFPADIPPPDEAPDHPKLLEYQARVEAARNRPPKPGEPPKEYGSPATTPLTRTIVKGTSRYDFDIP